MPFHITEHFHFSLKYLCPELINANFEIATEFLYYLAFTDHLNVILYQYVNCIGKIMNLIQSWGT